MSTLVFSHTGGILSHRNSSTHRFPRFPSRNLCSLIMLIVLSLSLGCNGRNLLQTAPADTRPSTPLISFCIVQLWTLCAAWSLTTLCLSAISGPGPGKLPGFWASMAFGHAPIPQKGSSNDNNNIILLKNDATSKLIELFDEKKLKQNLIYLGFVACNLCLIILQYLRLHIVFSICLDTKHIR